MFKNLRIFVTVICLAIPAWSATATISGYVRDSSGVPQMGAVVELLPLIGSDLIQPAQTVKAFTDGRGFYSIAKLLPGNYSLKVSEPSFLPTLRERIGIRAGARLMVNVTMTNLFEAIQLVTIPTQSDQDDWKWNLRAISNRPILRVLGDGTTAVVENGGANDIKGSLAFLTGSPGEGFGSASDMSTAFSVERSLLSTGTIRLNGDLGYSSDGVTVPSTFLRTSYIGHFNNISEPSFSLTALRLNSADPTNTLPGATLQALSLTSADRVILGNSLEMRLGSELQTIQFLGRVRAFKPFGSADLHLSPNTVLEYQYRSSVPRLTLEDLSGDSSDPAPDQRATGPRMSMTNFSPAVERARHQEVSLSQRVGRNNMQVAFFSDSIVDPVLTGIGGGLSAGSGDVLPDIFSGTFSYQGNNFATQGMRVVLERKLLSDLTATLDYSYGGVLDLSRPDIQLEDARSFIRTQTRQAVAAKLRGSVPKSKTRWIASYRYADRSLTPVDMFNTSAGQSDPYLNLFVRQPIPSSFLSGHLELLIDLRNLLAQGYVPVLGQDGHTVYLVQSARSVRGGLAFSF
ncbi:MAG: carboxypeptidase-like regulatory domain-containing protein [Terriglobales bacterium]